MKNLQVYDSLKSVPEWAKKKIGGGDIKGFTDIKPQWRIQAMTEQFGVCGIGWYYEITKQWLETSGNTISAFVNINLYIKYEGEWSMPIPGTGGNTFSYNTKSDRLKVSDECYKMATTDALSVAMRFIGVGADVYAGVCDSKYSSVNSSTTIASSKYNFGHGDNLPWVKDEQVKAMIDTIPKNRELVVKKLSQYRWSKANKQLLINALDK